MDFKVSAKEMSWAMQQDFINISYDVEDYNKDQFLSVIKDPVNRETGPAYLTGLNHGLRIAEKRAQSDIRSTDGNSNQV